MPAVWKTGGMCPECTEAVEQGAPREIETPGFIPREPAKQSWTYGRVYRPCFLWCQGIFYSLQILGILTGGIRFTSMTIVTWVTWFFINMVIAGIIALVIWGIGKLCGKE
jgi:hypothetical protein